MLKLLLGFGSKGLVEQVARAEDEGGDLGIGKLLLKIVSLYYDRNNVCLDKVKLSRLELCEFSHQMP